MKIGELASKMGLSSSTIRFYEKAGILPRAFRESGQRRFTDEAQLHLAVIEIARKAGFTVAEIRVLFHGFGKKTPASARWRRLAAQKNREMDLQIARLRSMQKLLRESMRCRCMELEDCGRILLSRRGAGC